MHRAWPWTKSGRTARSDRCWSSGVTASPPRSSSCRPGSGPLSAGSLGSKFTELKENSGQHENTQTSELGSVPQAVSRHCFPGGVVLFSLTGPRSLPFVLSFPDLLSLSSCPVVETVWRCKKSQSPSLIVYTLLETRVFTEEDKDGGG